MPIDIPTTTITLPIEQFLILIITVVGSALTVVMWIHNRIDKLKSEFDARLNTLDNRIREIQINFPTRVDSIDTLIEVIREDIRELRNRNERNLN